MAIINCTLQMLNGALLFFNLFYPVRLVMSLSYRNIWASCYSTINMQSVAPCRMPGGWPVRLLRSDGFYCCSRQCYTWSLAGIVLNFVDVTSISNSFNSYRLVESAGHEATKTGYFSQTIAGYYSVKCS